MTTSYLLTIILIKYVTNPEDKILIVSSSTIVGHADVHEQVHGVAHVEVKVGAGLVAVQAVAVGHVHLGPEVGPHEVVGHVGGQVEAPLSLGVARQGEVPHQIVEPPRHVVGNVVRGRPVLERQTHSWHELSVSC